MDLQAVEMKFRKKETKNRNLGPLKQTNGRSIYKVVFLMEKFSVGDTKNCCHAHIGQQVIFSVNSYQVGIN